MSEAELPELAIEIAPYWLELKSSNSIVTAIAHVPEGLAIFIDHFPGNPLVPGVVQLLWLQTLAQWAWPQICLTEDHRSSRLTGHQRVKFKLPVLPGDELRIELSAEAANVSFFIDNATGRCTDGLLFYESNSPNASQA